MQVEAYSDFLPLTGEFSNMETAPAKWLHLKYLRYVALSCLLYTWN